MCSEAKGEGGVWGQSVPGWRAGGRSGGLCVFMVAHRGVSQHRHVTGTFPAGNKTNVKSLEIKLVKPQCSACLSVSWGGVTGGPLRTPGPGRAAPGAMGCRRVSARLPGLHPLGGRTSSRDNQERLAPRHVSGPLASSRGKSSPEVYGGVGHVRPPEMGDMLAGGPDCFRQRLGAQSCDRTVPQWISPCPPQLFADSQVKLAFLNSSGAKCCLLQVNRGLKGP